jgi:hypothetical protein
VRPTRKLEAKTIRIVISSLLSSDLSTDELKLIAHQFSVGAMNNKIYVMIEDFLYNLEPPVKYDAPATSSTPDHVEIRSLIKNKRLSKAAFEKRADQILRGNFPRLNLAITSMDELLEAFLTRANRSEIDDMRLSLGAGADPFLSGIMKRSR